MFSKICYFYLFSVICKLIVCALQLLLSINYFIVSRRVTLDCAFIATGFPISVDVLHLQCFHLFVTLMFVVVIYGCFKVIYHVLLPRIYNPPTRVSYLLAVPLTAFPLDLKN